MNLFRFLFVFGFFIFLELSWSCHADEDKEGASFDVRPSHITLGSLAFGPNSTVNCIPFKLVVSGLSPGTSITKIDCSHAQGIRLSGQQYDGQNIVMNMEADVQTLCQGERYGAFIKREIRLETNSPDQPQFVVPVTGWLDLNNTSRNFDLYMFNGSARWQGIWSTPNVAGTELTGLALILTGLVGWLQKQNKTPHKVFYGTGFTAGVALICTTLIYLGRTYSREAWIALLFATGVVAISCPPMRRTALSVTFLFLIILLLLPHGLQRCESYANLTEDLSISNRFRLWEGALQIMAEHPVLGISSGQFEAIFERNYQGFNHTAKTTTAVNDFLTFGAEHGLPALSLIIGSILLLLILALKLVTKTHSILLMTLVSVLIGTLITSCFSSLWGVLDFQLLAGTALVGATGYVAIAEASRIGHWLPTRGLILKLSQSTSATLIVLSFAAAGSLFFLPTQIVSHQIWEGDAQTASFEAILPRWRASHGTIIYLTSIGDQSLLYHSTIRPIAAMGWRVIPLPDTTATAKVHCLIQALHKLAPKENFFIAGDARGGQAAWKIAAQESPLVVKAGCGFDFLTMDLAPEASISAPHQPFLVYQSLYTDGTSSNPAIFAQKKVAFKGLPLTVVLSSDGVNHFSAGWMNFLTTLNHFFSNENSHT